MTRRAHILAAALALGARVLAAQTPVPATPVTPAANAPPSVVAGIPVNYDESKVGTYTLPDPLVLANGTRVTDPMIWWARRRPEIVRLFEVNQFGRAPGRPLAMRFVVFDTGTIALDGKALRRQVRVLFTGDSAGPKMDLAIYLPADAKGPVPLLLNVSFGANSSTVNDPGLRPDSVWTRDRQRAPAPKPGPNALDVARFLAQGIGVATVYYGQIEPDFAGGLPYGVRAAFLKPGQTAPAPDEWGAIAAWSWGLSRAMDYLETDRGVDAKRVALLGVSRLGKTVLWTAARDERFALVIASCSGEGGAALSRRNYGETVAHITHPTRYGYQFAGNYATFADRVDQLPVDGHMLVALVAPRAVLLQTGDTDYWSDPKGEFLAAVAADPVFTLLGMRGVDTTVMPAAGQPILHTVGYLMHSGGHGIVPADWDVFLQFMRLHFFR